MNLSEECAFADLFHEAKGVDVHVELAKIEGLTVDRRTGNDYVTVGVMLDADLRSAFSWNTKQLFLYVQVEYETARNHINQIILWDDILEQKARKSTKCLKQEFSLSGESGGEKEIETGVCILGRRQEFERLGF